MLDHKMRIFHHAFGRNPQPKGATLWLRNQSKPAKPGSLKLRANTRAGVIQMPKKTKQAKTKKVQVEVRDIKPAKDAKGGAFGKVWVR
jgi:hypothetical protein